MVLKNQVVIHGSIVNDSTNRLTFVHQVERVVDFIESHGVGDEWSEVDFTFHRIFYHAWKLGTSLDTAECRALLGPASD